MFISKFKYLALATSTVVLLSPSAQAASSITVSVSPISANAVNDLIADFLNAYPTQGYSVSLRIVSDAAAKDAIIAGAAPVPDLFLSQSFLAPKQLQLNYPTLIVGTPFPYAQDTLVLYSSAGKNVDISAGIPNLGSLQQFSLPDPATLDPYGIAATLELKASYLYALKNGLVLKTPDAGSAYAAVEYLAPAYGFTGKSQICSAVAGYEEYKPGSFHHEFTTALPIVLGGVKIARTRSAAEEAELTDFINFLTTGAGKINFTQHCFKLPGA
jgi:molybdate transport system substrate-binding protein